MQHSSLRTRLSALAFALATEKTMAVRAELKAAVFEASRVSTCLATIAGAVQRCHDRSKARHRIASTIFEIALDPVL